MTRAEALHSLICFNRQLDELQECVAAFPFDWDGPPLATLRREHIIAVLARWQGGELTADDVEDWANFLEVRGDLAHDPADPAVASAIFELANPALQGDLAQVGPVLIKRLSLKVV